MHKNRATNVLFCRFYRSERRKKSATAFYPFLQTFLFKIPFSHLHKCKNLRARIELVMCIFRFQNDKCWSQKHTVDWYGDAYLYNLYYFFIPFFIFFSLLVFFFIFCLLLRRYGFGDLGSIFFTLHIILRINKKNNAK